MSPKTPRSDAVISESMTDLITPGVVVELDPDEAESYGPFLDDALDEETAWDANADL
jgi:hypothetical protein